MRYISSHFFRVLSISLFLFSGLQFNSDAQICEVISYTSNRTIEKGKLIKEDEILIQVNDRICEKFNKFEIPYSSKNRIKSIHAQIEDLSGKVIRKLKKNEIKIASATSSGSLYEDDFVSKFTLRHNQYPYRIRISYEADYEEYMNIAYWTPVENYDIPTRNATLIVKVPESCSINYRQKNTDEPEITHEDDLIVYTWNTSYLNTIEKEIFAPPMDNLLPEVIVVPEKFVYGIPGSFKDWKSFGQWSYNLNQGLDELPLSEKGKVADLIYDMKSDREKVNALYHYLQDNTRYIHVSIDIGGFKPYPAEYVCTNKYGDCKALSNYLKSLLKEAGIEAYYTLIFADRQINSLDTSFPMQYFNHVILNVPLEKDTLWLECTSQTSPFGYVGTSIQNRCALIVNDNASRLVKTPALTAQDTKTKRKVEMVFGIDGDASARFNISARGYSFEGFQGFNSYVNEHYKNMFIKDFFNYSSFEMSDWQLDQRNRDSSYVDLSASLVLNNYARIYNNDIIVKPISPNIPDFEHPRKRTLPVQINYPITKEDEIVYVWPKNWKPEFVPEDKSLKSNFGEYILTTEVQEDSITMKRYFTLNSGYYTLDEYTGFYEFIESVRKIEKSNAFIFK